MCWKWKSLYSTGTKKTQISLAGSDGQTCHKYSTQVKGTAGPRMTLTLTLHCAQQTAQLLAVLYPCKRGCQVGSSPYFGILHWQRGDLPHLLECGSIVKLLLRACGCLNYCSPTFPRLFNLTVLLPAQDKMENPCSGGLSELSTHSQEYGISLQIPSAHYRYDPINVRICHFSLSINDKHFEWSSVETSHTESVWLFLTLFLHSILN